MNPVPPVEQSIDQENFDMPPPPGSEASDQRENPGESSGSKQQRARDRAILAVEDSATDESQGAELESPPEDVLVFSAREVLRKKDFAQFSQDEIAEARRIIAQMNWRLGTRKTRRRERSNLGEYIDYRATLRRSMRHRGVPIELRRRRRKE